MLTFAPALASIPAPPFRNLEIGPLLLHGYGLMIGIAIVTALTICERGLRLQGVDVGRFQSFAIPAIIAGFIGGRLYHVASEPARFARHPEDIVAIWQGGLGIYGAIALGALVGLLIAPRMNIPRPAIADAIVPAILTAQAIGRLGNYLNQELYGRPTTIPWALEVDPEFRPDGSTQELYHPTFMYEALGTLAFAALFAVLLRRWTSRAPGILFPLYIAAYSAVRLPVERLRIDDAHTWLGLRQNEWVAGVLLVVALLFAGMMQLRHRARQARTGNGHPAPLPSSR